MNNWVLEDDTINAFCSFLVVYLFMLLLLLFLFGVGEGRFEFGQNLG